MSTIGFTADGEAPDETEEVAVEALFISDGETHIPNGAEFYELTGAIAAQLRDGQLYVLRRDTLKWVSVEDVHSLNKRAGKVTSIKGGAQ